MKTGSGEGSVAEGLVGERIEDLVETVDIWQVWRKRWKIFEAIKAKALEEVAGGLVEDGTGLILNAVFVDEPSRDEGLHNGLNVDPTDS